MVPFFFKIRYVYVTSHEIYIAVLHLMLILTKYILKDAVAVVVVDLMGKRTDLVLFPNGLHQEMKIIYLGDI